MILGILSFGRTIAELDRLIGTTLGLYASERNCLIAFLTQGYMSFWTAIEILAGSTALTGLIIAFLGFIRK